MATTQGQEFTASGTFNVPTNVSSVWITMVGGGGGGGAAQGGLNDNAGGGGGAGEFCRRFPVKATPGGTVAVVVGAGGVGGDFTVGGGFGGDGAPTSFGTYGVEGGWGGAPGNIAGAHTGCGSSAGGNGGGIGGLLGSGEGSCLTTGGGNSVTGNDGQIGQPEGPFHFGGSGGGRGVNSQYVTPERASAGGGCEGIPGGLGGLSFLSPALNLTSGGGGGGSSPFGVGGEGGSASDGLPPSAGNYGAGGGGSASSRAQFPLYLGGAGSSGYVFIQWTA